jgi:hypothetical protein
MTSMFLSFLLTLRTWARSRAVKAKTLDAGHLAGLASEVDRAAIRWERTSWAGTTALSRIWTGWRTALVIVKPETVKHSLSLI